MKKTILLVALLLCSVWVNAQRRDSLRIEKDIYLKKADFGKDYGWIQKIDAATPGDRSEQTWYYTHCPSGVSIVSPEYTRIFSRGVDSVHISELDSVY